MQRILVHKLELLKVGYLKFLSALVVVALIGLSILSISLVVQARQDQPFILSGQTVPLIKHAHLVGVASAQQKMDLSVGLQLRNQQEQEPLKSTWILKS